MSASSAGGPPAGSKVSGKSLDVDRTRARPGREQTDRSLLQTEARLTFAAILHSRYSGSHDAPARAVADLQAHHVKPQRVAAQPMPSIHAPAPDGTVTISSRIGAGAPARSLGTAAVSADATRPPGQSDMLQVTAATLESEKQKAIVSPTVASAPDRAVPPVLNLHARAMARAAGAPARWYDAIKERSARQNGDKETGVEIDIER